MISVIPHDGAIQVPSPTAIVKGSPHPNAAKLFAQFNLTPEIQHKFTEEGHHSPRVDIPPPPGLPRLEQLTLYPADYDFIEKNTKRSRPSSPTYSSEHRRQSAAPIASRARQIGMLRQCALHPRYP